MTLDQQHAPKYWMRRRRVETKPMDESLIITDSSKKKITYKEAKFVKGEGLEGAEFRVQWKKAGDERSVLLQSVDHYEQLKRHPKFKPLMDKINLNYQTSPSFGEQIMVKGMDATDVCIGDVFEVQDKLSPLVLEVTSPRLPSVTVDKRHGASMTHGTSMKEYLKQRGLAGWFARVLVDGDLRDGMTLQRVKHPHPKWTLAYTSQALYGEGTSMDQTFDKPTWHRSTQELYELSQLGPLANYQWKDAAKFLLYKQYYLSHKDQLITNNDNKNNIMNSFYNGLYNIVPWNNKEEEESAIATQEKKITIPSYTVPYMADTNQMETTPSVSMTIKGVYKKGKIPRKKELPYKHSPKDLAPDQHMVRSRLNIPTIHNDKKDDGTVTQAHFVPGRGLVCSGGDFYHMVIHEEHKHNDGLMEDRAVLWQSVQHYETIRSNPLYQKKIGDDYLTTPTFGEQVIIDGANSSQICIGDVFEVKGRTSTLVVEVTAPRKPCYVVDGRHDTSKGGMNGMKRYTMTHALAGWLTRVLVPGELLEDMTMVRTRNPHPKWTLTYISKVLLSEGNRIQLNCGTAHWARDDLTDLIELVNLPQLGKMEWKDDAEELLWKELQKRKQTLDDIIEMDNNTDTEETYMDYFSNLALRICT